MLTRVILERYFKQPGLLSPSILAKGVEETKVHWRSRCFVLSQLPMEKNSSSLTGMSLEQYWQARTTREDLTVLKIPQTAKSFLRLVHEDAQSKYWKLILATWIPTRMRYSKNRKNSALPSLTLQKKTSGMRANANSDTTPWKICWGTWQKEQESSLKLPDKPFIESDNSHCSVCKKTLRHVKLRLLLYIPLSNSCLIGRKPTVNFRNQRPWRQNLQIIQ